MSSVSVDDLRDDFETRSVAASHTSHLSGSRLGAGAGAYQSTRRPTKQLSRDSSKESSEESDETGFSSGGGGLKMVTGRTGHRTKQLVKQQSRHSEMSASSGVSDFSAVAPSAVSSVSVSPPEDRR